VPPTPEPTPEPTVEPTPEPTEAPVEDAAGGPETADDTEAPSDDAAEPSDAAAADDGAVPADDSAELTDDAAVPDGSIIFAASCANCHGADGVGTGRGPGFLGIGQFFPDNASPLIGLVTNGGTDMPEFGTKLTASEIDAVVQYVVATFE
jgi:mono/diheme cytochrome c family protein